MSSKKRPDYTHEYYVERSAHAITAYHNGQVIFEFDPAELCEQLDGSFRRVRSMSDEDILSLALYRTGGDQ